MYGKKQSAEYVQRRTEPNKKKVIRSDGVAFNSVNEAAQALNTNYQGVSQSLRKGHKCKGFTFKYL